MKCVNSFTSVLKVLHGQGVQSCLLWCCSKECLSLHWALNRSRKHGQLWHKDQEHWALTECVLWGAGRITGSRGSTGWKISPCEYDHECTAARAGAVSGTRCLPVPPVAHTPTQCPQSVTVTAPAFWNDTYSYTESLVFLFWKLNCTLLVAARAQTCQAAVN